jgi:hypothetical protein
MHPLLLDTCRISQNYLFGRVGGGAQGWIIVCQNSDVCSSPEVNFFKIIYHYGGMTGVVERKMERERREEIYQPQESGRR